MKTMKLKKGDKVLVLSGKDRGKSGSIVKVMPGLNKVVVDGINVVKRHVKPSAKHPRGGIIEEAAPLWASTVGLVNPEDSKRASRVGYLIKPDGAKVRVYRQAKNKEVKS